MNKISLQQPFNWGRLQEVCNEYFRSQPSEVGEGGELLLYT
jgi:hypothetical protein